MAVMLRIIIAAAFVKRIQFRVRWRRRWHELSRRSVADIPPEQMQSALIELCVFEAMRPPFLRPLLSCDSDDEGSDF